MPPYDVVTFDCYGTLIDWERGIAEAFVAAAAAARRPAPGREDVLTAYASIEPEVQSGPYRPYREILAETAARVGQRLGWPLGDEDAGFLAESLPGWPPFSDTNPALARLAAAGIRLGILSNVDEDLLERTREQIDAPFDLVVTAERVRSYKPGLAHFQAARAALGPGPRWLHAAQSYFHDVVPARALGIPVAWINRKAESTGDSRPPDAEFRNLIHLADWLTGA